MDEEKQGLYSVFQSELEEERHRHGHCHHGPPHHGPPHHGPPHHGPPHHGHGPPHHGPPHGPPPHGPPHHGHGRKGKVIKALAILGTVFIGYKTLTECMRIKYGSHHHNGDELSEKPAFSSVGEFIPHDVVIDHCTDWSPDSKSDSEKPERHNHRSVPDFLYEPRSSSASFDLPLSSDNLFLFSHGAAAGSFKLVQSSDLDPNGGVARVAVVAKYRLPSALEHVKVCSVTRRDTEHGVVIFAPKRFKHVRVGFEVTVYLPKAAEEGAVLKVRRFETHLPFFAHSVGDIGAGVKFGGFGLKTRNMPINVESVYATKAHISTTNGPIEGTFNASRFLELSTVHAKIAASIGLHNNGERGITGLVIKNKHAPIEATLSLISSTSSAGGFQIRARTALAPLSIEIPSAPGLSTLLLSAHTSLAPASVILPSTYEGRFKIATRLAKPEVVVEEEQGRNVTIKRVRKGEVRGSVYWESEGGEEGKERGDVVVTTSLAPVSLKL